MVIWEVLIVATITFLLCVSFLFRRYKTKPYKVISQYICQYKRSYTASHQYFMSPQILHSIFPEFTIKQISDVWNRLISEEVFIRQDIYNEKGERVPEWIIR